VLIEAIVYYIGAVKNRETKIGLALRQDGFEVTIKAGNYLQSDCF
jgi:hypothetical protein